MLTGTYLITVELENNLHISKKSAGCCTSWSANVDLDVSFVQGKLEWCYDHCLQFNHNCKIFGVTFEGQTFNWCMGSTSSCNSRGGDSHDEL